jgi:hypothetical protein
VGRREAVLAQFPVNEVAVAGSVTEMSFAGGGEFCDAPVLFASGFHQVGLPSSA